jgi:hypothetical protein
MSGASQGYGNAFPGDSNSELGAVAFVVRQMVGQMSTMKLVKVVAVHGGGEGQPAGTVDVQPLVSQIDGNGYGTPHGTVPGLPWSRAQGGKAGIICDPVVGDVGYVVAADRDISKVKSTKAAALPGTRRQFDIADGVYAGSCLNAAPTTYLLFTPDGYFKFVDASGNVIQSSATGIAITPMGGQPVTVNGALVVTGNLQLAGTIEAQAGGLYGGNIATSGSVTAGSGTGDSVTLQGHKHAGVQTGAGSTLAPTAGT